jgi:hypothetical protein
MQVADLGAQINAGFGGAKADRQPVEDVGAR